METPQAAANKWGQSCQWRCIKYSRFADNSAYEIFILPKFDQTEHAKICKFQLYIQKTNMYGESVKHSNVFTKNLIAFINFLSKKKVHFHRQKVSFNISIITMAKISD